MAPQEWTSHNGQRMTQLKRVQKASGRALAWDPKAAKMSRHACHTVHAALHSAKRNHAIPRSPLMVTVCTTTAHEKQLRPRRLLRD
eukprot:2673163-Amphidinium_carterae.1